MEISEKILTAFIAAGVSFVVSIVTYFSSQKALISKEKQFNKEIELKFVEKLYELRLDCYPEAFALTNKIKRKKAPDYINTSEELQDILNNLEEWVEGKAGLFLSKNAIKAYRNLRDALGKNPAFSDKYSQDQGDKIWETRNEFRRWLRRDIGNIYSED